MLQFGHKLFIGTHMENYYSSYNNIKYCISVTINNCIFDDRYIIKIIAFLICQYTEHNNMKWFSSPITASAC